MRVLGAANGGGEVIEVVRRAEADGRPLCVIGGGSKLVAGDGIFDGVVVRDLSRRVDVVSRTDDAVVLRVDGGMQWADLAGLASGPRPMSFIAQRIRRCTGFWPSHTSGSARLFTTRTA